VTVIFIPPADQELKEAIEYYDDQLAGLGQQFYAACLATIHHICQAPDAWQQIGKHTRRINLKGSLT
jgi:hypothetical protein